MAAREPNAPTGTVVLVFTDVQGSTALWEQVPDAMRRALAMHDALIRQRIADHDGYEVKTEGDAFMVAFTDAHGAVRWCLDAQASLLELDWPAPLLARDEAAEVQSPAGQPLHRGLRVRMGAHVGVPDARPDPLTGRMDYFGPMVNRAARVSAAAHGGQVLVSGALWAVLGEEAGHDAASTDRGEHRLKGLEGTERLVEVYPTQLSERAFPPLRTLDAHKTNLQPHPTSFVGRTEDLDALQARLGAGARLLTLLGPGGTGKTRLCERLGALELHRYAEQGGGVWFCPLAEVHDLDTMVQAVGTVLGVGLASDSSTEQAVLRLGTALRARSPILVLLDNVEQIVAEAADTIAVWLREAPEAQFVVTSRERLRTGGEEVYDLAPLPPPRAVQLFGERARAVNAGVRLDEGVVEEIVERLDRLPLAIELAAARCRVLSVEQISQRLSERFRLLSGAGRGKPARHATLRAAIDWSWELLTPVEREVLVQCCVFHGGFSLEAAEAVVGVDDPDVWTLDVIEGLRDKSLLRTWEPPEAPGTTRFGMFMSVLEYVQEKDTESEGREAASARHLAWCLEFFRAIGLVDDAKPVDYGEGIIELDNLLAAADRASESAPSEAIEALVLAIPFVRAVSPSSFFLQHASHALELAQDIDNPTLVMRALIERSICWDHLDDYVAAERDARQALTVAQSAGDRWWQARAWSVTGTVLATQRHYDAARTCLGHSREIWSELGDLAQGSHVASHMAYTWVEEGNAVGCLRELDEWDALQGGDGRRPAWFSHIVRAILALEAGDWDKAYEQIDQTGIHSSDDRDVGGGTSTRRQAICEFYRGHAALGRGQSEAALELLKWANSYASQLPGTQFHLHIICGQAAAHAMAGRWLPIAEILTTHGPSAAGSDVLATRAANSAMEGFLALARLNADGRSEEQEANVVAVLSDIRAMEVSDDPSGPASLLARSVDVRLVVALLEREFAKVCR